MRATPERIRRVIFMEHRKVDADKLRVGMYVARLDRPWLESPFLFQGFTIQDEHELEQLRETCDHVFIDVEKSGDLDVETLQSLPSTSDEIKVEFNEELKRARSIRNRGMDLTSQLLKDERLGESLKSEQAREVVSDLMVSLTNNPNAALWLTNLERQHEYVAAHSMDTCIVAMAFARHLGYERQSLEAIGMGALLHDIGLMRTPTEILEKPGELTDEEFEIVSRHPREGYNVLRLVPGMSEITLNIVRYHHERVDGSGYPYGLKDDDIPREALLVAIADAYDALTTPRPYVDQPLSPHGAVSRLREAAATDFGGDLIEQFMRCIGIYPVGSLVELTSGALAAVVSHTQRTRLSPVVMMLRDADGHPYKNRPLVNLDALVGGMDTDRWRILSVRDPSEVGIDMAEVAEATVG